MSEPSAKAQDLVGLLVNTREWIDRGQATWEEFNAHRLALLAYIDELEQDRARLWFVSASTKFVDENGATRWEPEDINKYATYEEKAAAFRKAVDYFLPFVEYDEVTP